MSAYQKGILERFHDVNRRKITRVLTRKMKPLLIVTAFLLAVGCSSAGGPAGRLVDVESARARWMVQAMQSYRFDFERTCFCVPEAREPVTVEVRNGVVAAVRSRNTGASMLPSEILTWPTIDELFEVIEEAGRNSEEVVVEYDRAGYPTVVQIGSLAADAGTRYLISNVSRLE